MQSKTKYGSAAAIENAITSRPASLLARLFVPRQSAREELAKDLEEPFRRPERFGWVRFWWDESPHSMAASISLCLFGLLLTLTTGIGGSNDPGPPSIGVEQVVLGSSVNDLPQSNFPSESVQQQTMQRQAPTPVDPIEKLDTDFETGRLPTDIAPPASTAPKGPDISNLVDELRGLNLPSAKPSSGSGGGVGLSGILRIDKSVESVIYVIDKSSSMGIENRLERVKFELIDAINKMTNEQRFSVVFYDDTAWPLYSQQGGAATGMSTRLTLLQATRENKVKVVDWVQRMYASGGTNPLPASMAAVTAKPELVVLLSDGEFDPTMIDLITQENDRSGRKKGRIDCVGIGEIVFTLQEIAKKNGGVYRSAR